MGGPLWWVLQGFWVGIGLQAGYILGQERVLLAVGCSWLGQWTFGAFLFLPFHYPPQSTLGRFLLSSPMDRQQHQCLRIQNFLPGLLVATVDMAPPPWCRLGTLPLYSLPLDDQAAGQALKLNTASYQFSYQFHFEAHRIFGPGSSP